MACRAGFFQFEGSGLVRQELAKDRLGQGRFVEIARGVAVGESTVDDSHLRHKTHLLFTWLADLVRHPRILDAVEDLYGPDLLCWTTNFFIKEKANPAFVSWHQDSTYWGLSQPDVVTAWVALP